MPNGSIAECYAKTVAEGVARAAYPQGFAAPYWRPSALNEPARVKAPSGIFIGSMTDIMGTWVTDEQINQILEVCQNTPRHIYFILTKNAPRLRKFHYPANVWVGVSIPPSFMFGHELTPYRQGRMLNRSLDTLSWVNATVRWMSAEPLSFDITEAISLYEDVVDWIVVGAASNGPKLYPPSARDLANLVSIANCHNIPLFYKGNMRSLPEAVISWREEFPEVPVHDNP